MKQPIKNETGLSLIELMVTSVVAVIFGLIIYSVFMMYSNTSRISISFFFLQQQHENVLDQIARDVRKASYALGPGETPTNRSPGYDTVRIVSLWDASGPFTQYTISAGQLFEGGNPLSYEAGGGTVQLNADSSYFILDPQRKKMKTCLSLRRTYLNTTYSLSPREELIVCRN